ncbi:porin [Pelagibacterales bacterium SAG-MED33]|nr:porin [Pelagibacterales bacterium SAG-MED33]
MNKLTKIGISALAGSLIAVSAHAGSMSVTGSASLTFSNTDDQSAAAEGNGWTMGDSLTFAGSGEMDNGMTIAVSYELDGDAATSGNELDDHSMTLSSDAMGSITFAGHGGDGAMSAIDDKTPTAMEESWDVVAGASTPPNGLSGENMFKYVSPDMGGATVTVGYLNASDDINDVSYMDFAVAISPEMIDGLTVGFGMGETEAVTGTVIDDQTMYATYAYGSLTVGYQVGESDGAASSSDIDFTGMGASYAITDDVSVSYNTSTIDLASSANDQEASAIAASYTSGGITVKGTMHSIDNVGHTATSDLDGYEFNIGFAF